MDLFFEICHHKTHIFVDSIESRSVFDLKKIIEGVLKVSPENQQLYRVRDGRNIGDLLDDSQSLLDAGYNSQTARAQQPALIGLAMRQKDGNFEACQIDSLSEPPPLPDVMRSSAAVEPVGSGPKHEEQSI